MTNIRYAVGSTVYIWRRPSPSSAIAGAYKVVARHPSKSSGRLYRVRRTSSGWRNAWCPRPISPRCRAAAPTPWSAPRASSAAPGPGRDGRDVPRRGRSVRLPGLRRLLRFFPRDWPRILDEDKAESSAFPSATGTMPGCAAMATAAPAWKARSAAPPAAWSMPTGRWSAATACRRTMPAGSPGPRWGWRRERAGRSGGGAPPPPGDLRSKGAPARRRGRRRGRAAARSRHDQRQPPRRQRLHHSRAMPRRCAGCCWPSGNGLPRAQLRLAELYADSPAVSGDTRSAPAPGPWWPRRGRPAPSAPRRQPDTAPWPPSWAPNTRPRPAAWRTAWRRRWDPVAEARPPE